MEPPTCDQCRLPLPEDAPARQIRHPGACTAAASVAAKRAARRYRRPPCPTCGEALGDDLRSNVKRHPGECDRAWRTARQRQKREDGTYPTR